MRSPSSGSGQWLAKQTVAKKWLERERCHNRCSTCLCTLCDIQSAKMMYPHFRRQLLVTVCFSFALLLLVFENSELRQEERLNSIKSQNPVLSYLRGLQQAVSKAREEIDQVNNYPEESQTAESEEERATIWITMGLCWSKTTELYGKRSYPYATVTPLAALLWKYFTNAHVLVTVVYDEDEPSQMLKEYTETLKETGAEVRWSPSNGTDCVLASQLIRLFAFKETDLIRPYDVVVTIDVNAFVMTEHILDPIYENENALVWIYQYYDTAAIPTGNGETFNQNLMSMRADTWKQILDYRDGLSMQDWIEERIVDIDLDRNNSWYYDQWITTYGILKHKLCSVPSISGLWNLPGIQFETDDDYETCWHGKGYKDCNEDIRIVYQGCKWWHFFPNQDFQAHVDKFLELTNHTINISFKKSPFED